MPMPPPPKQRPGGLHGETEGCPALARPQGATTPRWTRVRLVPDHPERGGPAPEVPLAEAPHSEDECAFSWEGRGLFWPASGRREVLLVLCERAT